jgi:Zn-finger nucleic acid-binding protein
MGGENVSCPGCGASTPPTGLCRFCRGVVLLEGAAGKFLASDLSCPRCDPKQPLQGLEHDGVRADLCGQCHGAWFATGALAEALRRAAKGPRRRGEGARAPAHGGMEPVRYIRCPRCGGGMSREALSRKPLVMIDRCPGCGDWCDGGEFAQLRTVARERGAEAALGAAAPGKAPASAAALEDDPAFREMLKRRPGGDGIFPAGMRDADGTPAELFSPGGILRHVTGRRRGPGLLDLLAALVRGLP